MRLLIASVVTSLPLLAFACGGNTKPPTEPPPQPTSTESPLSLPTDAAVPDFTAADADAASTGPEVKVLARNLHASAALAVDQGAIGNVYWIDEGQGELMRVGKRGGAQMTIYSGTGAAFNAGASVAVDLTDVYWTAQVNNGTPDKPRYTNVLSRMDKNGGKTTIVSSSPTTELKCVVVDQTDMFWVSGGSVMRGPKNGDPPTSISSGQKGVNCVAIDDANVYWSAGGTDTKQYKDGGLWMAPRKGGAAKPVVKDAERAADVQVDDTNVYWISSDKVMAAPKAGGGAPKVLATAAGPVGDIAVYTGFVYFTSYRAGSDGTVSRVAIGGGDPTVLASGQNQPAGIAVDYDSVYWSCRGTEEKKYEDGSISRVDKP
jgi:hypothetical protein